MERGQENPGALSCTVGVATEAEPERDGYVFIIAAKKGVKLKFWPCIR